MSVGIIKNAVDALVSIEYNTPKIGVIPGTFEMEALAKSVTRVIRGEEKANLYKIRNQHQYDILRKEEEA